MYIHRTMQERIKTLAKKFKVITILGPRQSGKSTLAKATFPEYTYVTLEDFETRELALNDPRGFLKTYENKKGVIFDEIQRAPHLFSYLQTIVDESPRRGYYILTGSQNFLLNQAITQSLAGRVAIFTLLPLSIKELEGAGLLPTDLNTFIFKGCYPGIYAENIAPTDFYPNYIMTYVERDVRNIRNVTNLGQFQLFIKLCAGRIGQLLNLTSLANDANISVPTAKAWISILEQSYILFLLRPHFKNFSKRLVKMPKLYFYDTGLACSLLGITSPEQLATHYLRGSLFEATIISDILKQQYSAGFTPRCYFWRDKTGHEVDCIIEKGTALIPVEIKAGQTIQSNFFKELSYWNKISLTKPENNIIIYGGTTEQKRSLGHVIGWPLLPKYSDLF